MLDSSSLQEAVWRVRPLATPRVLRHCPRCERTRAFESSNMFRTNAQQRQVDVWLLYRCAACEHTWKRAVLRRTTPERIAPDLYARFQRNDRATAWACAFAPDPALSFDAAGEVAVDRPPLGAGSQLVRLEVPWPCAVRLDRLLAAELGLSRSALLLRVRSGRIGIVPLGAGALRRPPRDGTIVLLDGHDEA